MELDLDYAKDLHHGPDVPTSAQPASGFRLQSWSCLRTLVLHMLQMCILDGNAYDNKCLETGQEREDDLDACSLLLNNKVPCTLCLPLHLPRLTWTLEGPGNIASEALVIEFYNMPHVSSSALQKSSGSMSAARRNIPRPDIMLVEYSQDEQVAYA